MKKTRILFIGLVMTLILLAIPLFSAQAQDKMPDPIDPQSWLLHRDMTWHDLRPNPVIDWMKDLNEAGLNNKFAWGGNDSNSVIVGGFVMFEYLERKFISRGEVGSDPLGYYLFKNDGTGYESEKTRNPVLDTYQLIADEKYGGDKSKVTDADFAQWWVDYLNKPQKVNNGVTISEFWRENSYGQWSVDLRPYGPFTIPYFEFETMGYCINSRFQTYNDVPPSFRRGAAASGYFSFDSIAQAMAVDEGVPFRDFDFFFLVHAGNAESGAWQEFGQLQFPTRKDIPYELGPGPRMKTVEEFFTDNPDYLQLYVDRYAAYPGGATFRANLDAYNALKAGGKEADFVFHLSEEDWAWVNGYNDMTVKNTRYVDFTSWEAAVSEWSHAGSYNYRDPETGQTRSIRRSTQGENSGMSVFAHEFGHISGIADNYGDPWGDVASPATEPWEQMSRGSFSGPFGDHARWTVPGIEASTVPVHFMQRNKEYSMYYYEGDVLILSVEQLAGGTPMVAEVVSRNIPLANEYYPWLADYGLISPNYYKAIKLNFGSGAWADQAALRTSGFTWTRKAASLMTVEVVDRSGYDSFNHDHGVLISRTHTNTGNPSHAIIDAHLYDIDMVDFYLSGEPNYYPVAHSTQLADAAFHAGVSYTDSGYYKGSEFKGDKRASNEVISGDTVNEFYDPYNKLHFYILEKNLTPAKYGEFLSYSIGMLHDNGQPVGGELKVELADVETETPGRVAVATFAITNTGEATDIVRVGVDGGALNTVLLNNLYAIGAGQTINVPVYVDIPKGAPGNKKVDITVSSESNAGKTASATAMLEDLMIHNFYVYMDSSFGLYEPGETIYVDVMLKGDKNYTQLNTTINYDAACLEYLGHEKLAGLVGEVKKDGADKISVRNVPSINMMLGAPCNPPLRIVTLKFKVKEGPAPGSVIDSALTFAATTVNPTAGAETTTAPGQALPFSIMVFAPVANGDIARQFVVDDMHAGDKCTENALTMKEFAPNSILTDGVIDPFFAAGGTQYIPTNRPSGKVKIYVIALDFNDCPGDVFIPYGLQRNIFISPNDGSTFDLSYPEIFYNTVFFGSQGLKTLDSSKFVWKGNTAAHEFKGLKQLVEEMSMDRFEIELVCLNERLAQVQGLNPATDKWPWFHVDGPIFEYATQGPADCEDYRQFARMHQAGINAAYDAIPGLDIEDIDFIYTIVPYNTHGYRSSLQGGSGLDTSFAFNDQALMQRDSEYRHEPGIHTKGGRVVGSGVFGVKGIWGYTGNGFPSSSPNPMSAVRVSLHELTHNMGMIDDYSYGGMGTNRGEATASGVGGWGVMGSYMGTGTPDLFAWRKFRMGWINNDEIETVLPGESKIINIRALGSYNGDGGSYTDDPAIKTRLVLIPKEWRTRDTFGIVWNNGWNPNKTDYNKYDWFTNPWVGGETNAVKSFPTFYTLECRKPLGADSTMPATGGNAGGSAGVVVGYVANPTWQTGHGAGGFKVMTGNNGLRAGGTAAFSDANIGLTVTVLQSNAFYDTVEIKYSGIATSEAKHIYQGMLTLSDNYVTADQNFTVDFDIFTLGTPAVNDAATVSTAIQRVATPLAVPGGIAGFTMDVTFDAGQLEYVSTAKAPFNCMVNTDNAAGGKLTITAKGKKMVDKDTILRLSFKAKAGAVAGDYAISAAITDVLLLNWRGAKLNVGDPGLDGVGAFGDGTLAALYNANADNTYTPGIRSTGGLVRVGAVATHTISGTITCDTPGPAPGAWIGVESVVQLYDSGNSPVGDTVKSDWDGNYTIKGVPAGNGYYIKANKPKYDEGATAAFNINAADVTVSELKLNRTLYTVSGTIYGSDNSDGSDATPLAGVKVYVVNTGNCYEILGGPAITNADGTYTLEARTEHKQFVAIAVSAEGFGSHVTLSDGTKTNLGLLFGRNPADAAFGTTTQLGVNNLYNFALNVNRSGVNITLSKTQDVQLRVTPYSTATTYQLRDMNGNAVGAPVNSWGGMTTTRGDDVLRNVAPGRYYIEVSRPGYISSYTTPFTVSSTRAILRNNVGTHALTLVATDSGQTLAGTVLDAVTGLPIEGVKIVSLPYIATYGMGVPLFTAANGTFSYLTVNSARDLVFSKEGYISQTIYHAAGNASGLVIELAPVEAAAFTAAIMLIEEIAEDEVAEEAVIEEIL